MGTLTIAASEHGNFTLNGIFTNDEPTWFFVNSTDWQRTGVRIVLGDSEPRLDVNAGMALCFGADGAERVLEAARFLECVRVCQKAFA